MQTSLSPEFQDTANGKLAEDILRNCVHCGFCNATCPTYELLGDELDGPRGRIYQMKKLFEGEASGAMRLHLDRCLLCRACEPACPSGVRYSTLLEVSKTILDEKFPRNWFDRMCRRIITQLFSRRHWFAALLPLGRCVRAILPRSIADQIPLKSSPLPLTWPTTNHSRKVIALAGCVQSVVATNTNLAAAHVLDRLGITLVEVDGAGCCGGVALHTCGEAEGSAAARALIDRWLPHLDEVEAIVMTASGCGVTLKDYPRLLANDAEYSAAAKRIGEKTIDLCELVTRELSKMPSDEKLPWTPVTAAQKVAFHAPCTLQHGMQISGNIESILMRAGHTLCAVRDSHLCCGSAGTYSILQPKISTQLRRAKQAALAADHPDVVCTANIGCQLQLAQGTAPVVHWIELLL